MVRNAREIEQAAIAKIALLIEEFGAVFASRAVGGNMGVLDAIEEDWASLKSKTEEVYRQMVSDLTDSIDEREMIAKKKLNGELKELPLKQINRMPHPY